MSDMVFHIDYIAPLPRKVFCSEGTVNALLQLDKALSRSELDVCVSLSHSTAEARSPRKP